MTAPFNARRLRSPGSPNNLFTTAIQATQTFVRQRMSGRYRDLIALIEFGNAAYVITPFTNDYDNVLLSASLIGQWEEYERFPDVGTTIGTGIQQAIGLFAAFKFREAAGNAIVIFSDGQDTETSLGGRTIRDVMMDATAAQIPIYFIRCGLNRKLGDVAADTLWKPAVESTGGRFYAAAGEQDVLAAISDIDRRSAGTIQVKQYATHRPEFMPFALAASLFWLFGVFAKLTVPFFNKFP
jgi:Ca-activated chloride channel family protein